MAALALAAWFCLEFPPASFLLRASYDTLQLMAQPWVPAPSAAPVVLVYMDADSHAALRQDPAGRWDRSLHARLVRRMTRAAARAVIFDVIFDQPARPAGVDADFARALQESGRVILAGELVQSSHEPGSGPGTRTQSLTLPLDPLRREAAGWGLANLITDSDFTVRRYFGAFDDPALPSISWALAQRLQLPTLAEGPAQRWLRYYGPPLSLPHVSYVHALDPAAVPDEVFRDKVVLVGARPATGTVATRRDEFRDPIPAPTRHPFAPAVEVHATQVMNLIRNESLRRLPRAGEWLAFGLSAALVGWGFARLRPGPAAGAAAGGLALSALLALTALLTARTWFPWLIVAGVQLPLAWLATVLARSVEWYRARRELEAQRHAAETRIREQAMLIDAAQDAILLLDLEHRVIYANPSAIRLYGWPDVESVAGRAAIQLLAVTPDTLAPAIRAVREHGEWSGSLEQRGADGRALMVDSRWTLIRTEGGDPKSILVINTDVTEKRRLEAQFLRSQRLDAVGALAGGMAHDLNNALAPVLFGLQRLRSRVADDEGRRMLAIMETNTRRGAEMVRQVLTFARGRDDTHERFHPGQLLREMERFGALTFPTQCRIVALVPEDLWPVSGNPTQLHQVLMNLCVNARDAMPAGGQITLAADNVDITPAEAAALPDGRPGPHVLLLVADTGTGLSPEARARLFEPFFTTKPPGRGTGLGLPTTARIVRAHGGFLQVRSEPGNGTTFEIYLPRAPAANPTAPASLPAPPPRGHGETVLLIESEITGRDILQAALVDHGYHVLTAAGGIDGLALWLAEEKRIRVVVAGFSAESSDPAGTLGALRSRRAGLPIIVLTSGDGSAPWLAADSGLVRLAKPFAAGELLRLLHAVLHASPPDPAP